MPKTQRIRRGLAVFTASVLLSSDPASSASFYDAMADAMNPFVASMAFMVPQGTVNMRDAGVDPSGRAVAQPFLFGVHQTENFGFTVEPREPNPGGVMTRTSWRSFRPARSGRMVVATYGSNRFGAPLDTVLAVYRVEGTGTAARFVQLAFSDNRPLPGVDLRNTVVSFDVEANRVYAIQVGTRSQAEGTLRISAAQLPPGGGLALLDVGETYRCDLTVGAAASACKAPSYILHNSSARTLTVTATTGLASGITVPPPFVLPAGGVVRKSFAFSSGFSTTAARSATGRFVFTGRVGAVAVAQASSFAAVTVHATTTAPALKIAAFQQIYAGETGQIHLLPLAIYNTGTVPAVGCTVARDVNVPEGMYETLWQAYARPSGIPSPVFQPFSVPAGGATDVLVNTRLIRDNLADLVSGRNLVVHCANARFFPPAAEFDDTSRFDVTGYLAPRAALAWLSSPPSTDTLVVPTAGTVFRGEFQNKGVAAQLKARAALEGDGAGFKVSVCPVTATDAQCLASTTRELSVTVAANAKVTLKVAVKPTATATTPGVATLVFVQPGFPEVPVGGTMKVVRSP